MKHSLTSLAAVLLIGAPIASATAEDQPSPKGPPQTMGDEGKLPATGTMSGAVPEMGATGASEGASGSASPKGPAQTMGDEGKLPATSTMGGAVPQMTPPAVPEK